MLSEFKEFAMKGNLVDMAVGFIMGGAFGTVVKSLVTKVIMPPIGMLMGGVDFSSLKFVWQEASVAPDGTEVAEVASTYGALINDIIAFLILAWVVFLLVKGINKMQRAKEEEEAAAPPAPPKQEVLLEEIRDLLGKS